VRRLDLRSLQQLDLSGEVIGLLSLRLKPHLERVDLFVQRGGSLLADVCPRRGLIPLFTGPLQVDTKHA
jgi:hypothetical protein